jgi:hypothetical protein
MRNRKLFTLASLTFLAANLLTGCSKSNVAVSPNSSSTSETSASATPSPSGSSDTTADIEKWNCEKTKGSYSCEVYDNTEELTTEKFTYTLNLFCNLENSIPAAIITAVDSQSYETYGQTGNYEDLTSVIWPKNRRDFITMQIDSGEVSAAKVFVTDDAETIYFAKSSSRPKAGFWDFLTDIASATNVTFQGIDALGKEHNFSFRVADSVPIAATMAALGCTQN